MNNETCGRCGGRNKTSEVCPECGRPPNMISTGKEKQDVTAIAPKLENLNIPRTYLGVRWTKEMFWSSHAGKRANRLVSIFVDQMEKVHDMFAGGQLPSKSALFIAPAGHSKMVWAYSCMQYALTNEFTVAPILDTLEIKRLFVLSAERPKQIISGVSYEQYISSDVLFFTVTKTEQRKNAADIISELLDKRARRGKCTIGLSRSSLSEISQWDTANSATVWRQPETPVDPLKVPTVVTCL